MIHEKLKTQHDDPEQSKRFIDTAHPQEADETEGALIARLKR
jgi:hypothetical protein